LREPSRMEFPGFQNIFSIGEPFATRPFRGSLREEKRGLDYYALASGRLVPARPIRIVPYGGQEAGDFIWTDAAVVRLVSQRVLGLFRDAQLAGWSTFPVEVYDRERRAIGGFSGFSVVGRYGMIDPALSTPIQKQMPGGVFPYFVGYLFDPTSWDGSHIFSPEGTAHMFITRSVYDLLRGAKAKNVEYRPITEMDFGEYEKSLMEAKLRKT
jgi:hypothetical protein